MLTTVGQEIDLLCDYPKSKRDLNQEPLTERERAIARKFGKDFFDGDRRLGYGGYKYDPIFWTATVRRFRDHYKLDAKANILDVGCGRGFMLSDFRRLMPSALLRGIDVSSYAIRSAMSDVADCVKVGSAHDLPFPEPYPRQASNPLAQWADSFDLVISVNTIHNLPLIDCKEALREIMRVKKPEGHAFVTVDAWRNDEERQRMEAWNKTALTMMHVDDWKQLFVDVGYTGDYYWFTP